MRQFINGCDAAFDDLEYRAQNACVVFPNQQMPPGASPAWGRVGFEVNPQDGSAILYVDHGITYSGPNHEVRAWLADGQMRFPDFAALRDWLRETLAPCYTRETVAVRTSTQTRSYVRSQSENRRRHDVGLRSNQVGGVERLTAESLTDLEAIHQNLPDYDAPLYISDEHLFSELSNSVRGQDIALRVLSRRVSQHLARRKPRRPATLFLIGPTGVGKTRTAESLPIALKALAPEAASYNYLRLDMSEYQERHRISQLLGAPQGYIGYGDGAQLVDALAANPKTVVLFDEIEKAHANVLRALMNAMDAGRVSRASSGRGRDEEHGRSREIDCRFAIFLFTSNLDASSILQELEERDTFDDPQAVDVVCRNRLRAVGIAPELIGRIRSFLVVRPLTISMRAEIVTLAISQVANEYGLHVEHIEPAVITHILHSAGSAHFGARPDEYFVQEVLGDAFARAAAIGPTPRIIIRGGPPFECIPVG